MIGLTRTPLVAVSPYNQKMCCLSRCLSALSFRMGINPHMNYGNKFIVICRYTPTRHFAASKYFRYKREFATSDVLGAALMRIQFF